MNGQSQMDYGSLSDKALARLFAMRDPVAVRIITSANNQRLFRLAWCVLKDRSEAEDVVQSTYLRAFTAIASFEGRSTLTTWLTRIAINEAIERRRSTVRHKELLDANSVTVLQTYRNKPMQGSVYNRNPEDEAARGQLRKILEEAISRLPERFRMVFVLREVEQLSVAEVSESLGIPAATVKTRCLRARRMLQEKLSPEIQSALAGAFPFAGADCETLTENVLRALESAVPDTSSGRSETSRYLATSAYPQSEILKKGKMPQSENPRSTAKIAGHPIHPMLVPFPIAFLIGTLASDVIYWLTTNSFWATASFYLLVAALIMALLAAPAGLIDFLGDRRIRAISHAWQHMVGNIVAVLLSVANLLIRMNDLSGGVLPYGLSISLAVAVLLIFTGWRGGDLIYRHRVGIPDRK